MRYMRVHDPSNNNEGISELERSSLFTAGTFISLPVSLQMVANVNWNYRSAKLIEICIGHNVMAVLPGCYHSYYHSQTYHLKTQLLYRYFRDIVKGIDCQ